MQLPFVVTILAGAPALTPDWLECYLPRAVFGRGHDRGQCAQLGASLVALTQVGET